MKDIGLLVVDFVVVFQAVPHSLATHHHVWRGPRGGEAHVPGTEPSPVSSYWGSDVSPGYMPTRSLGPLDSVDGDSSASPVFYPSGRAPRGRQAEASSSLSCPTLLCSEPEVDASPASSVRSSPYSPCYHPLRSRSGRNNAESSVERP